MKRNMWLLIGVLSALLMASAGGAAVSAAPETSTVDAVFPIGPLEGDKYGLVADMDAAGNMIVAWDQANGVFVQRVNADGTPNGGPLQANTTADNSPNIGDLSADAAGNFVIVWETFPDYEPRGRCFDAAGNPNGAEFPLQGVSINLGFEPAVEMAPDGSFIAVWQEQFYAGGYNYELMGRRYSAACAPLGDPFLVNNTNTGDEGQPDIAMDAAGNFIVAWSGSDNDGGGVFARRFDAAAAPRGGQFRVNQRQPFDQGGPSVGMDAAGNAVIAFGTSVRVSGGEFNYDVLVRRYNAAGNPMGNEFSPHSPSLDPQSPVDVAVAPSGDFAVMWTFSHLYDRELWLQAYDASGAAIGQKRPVAVGDGDQYLVAGALVTGNGDAFLAAWVLGQTQIYGRLMDLSEPVNAQVYQPTNDAYVMEARPNNTYGSQKVLQVKDAAKDVNTYVKFNVGGLSGTVESATLRLWVTDPGPDGGAVYAVSPFYRDTTTLWLETGLTWANAPVIGGAPLDVAGAAVKGQWVEFDVTAAVAAALGDNGRMSLAIVNDSANAVKYAGKEGAKPPELIVYTD